MDWHTSACDIHVHRMDVYLYLSCEPASADTNGLTDRASDSVSLADLFDDGAAVVVVDPLCYSNHVGDDSVWTVVVVAAVAVVEISVNLEVCCTETLVLEGMANLDHAVSMEKMSSNGSCH